VVAYLNNHLLVTSTNPGNARQKFSILREHLSFSLHRAFQAPHQGANVGLAKKSLENLGKFMWQDDFPWKLVWEMLYRDYTLYNHSVNVGVMGMALMAYLKKPGRDGLTMGLAGLFHDLGMICLSEEFVHKADPLNHQEREALKKHPYQGYRLLQNTSQVPLDALRLILEHHENADGTGYPQGLTLSHQHPHTRFLYIIEAYDGLTTFRPYRPAHTPFAALKILQEPRNDQGLVCEPLALKKFIQFLALA
jgi:HD-GYP domain-containing protein (c-di-GMP phosphodiesterase class II)